MVTVLLLLEVPDKFPSASDITTVPIASLSVAVIVNTISLVGSEFDKVIVGSTGFVVIVNVGGSFSILSTLISCVRVIELFLLSNTVNEIVSV